MTNYIWDLDDFNRHVSDRDKAKEYIANRGYDKGTNAKYKVGDTILFNTGFNNDIRAKASIKGLDGDDIYVYNDCYWFPIQDTKERNIELCTG